MPNRKTEPSPHTLWEIGDHAFVEVNFDEIIEVVVVSQVWGMGNPEFPTFYAVETLDGRPVIDPETMNIPMTDLHETREELELPWKKKES